MELGPTLEGGNPVWGILLAFSFVSNTIWICHHTDTVQLQLEALELLSGEGCNKAFVLCSVPFYVKWNKICLNQSTSKCQKFCPVLWFKHILIRRKGLSVAYNATMPSPEILCFMVTTWKVTKNKMFDLIGLQKKKFDWMCLWKKIVRHVMLKEMKCLRRGEKT